jgi:hypothetical protein
MSVFFDRAGAAFFESRAPRAKSFNDACGGEESEDRRSDMEIPSMLPGGWLSWRGARLFLAAHVRAPHEPETAPGFVIRA